MREGTAAAAPGQAEKAFAVTLLIVYILE